MYARVYHMRCYARQDGPVSRLGVRGEVRTPDNLIKSQVRFQLRHTGMGADLSVSL